MHDQAPLARPSAWLRLVWLCAGVWVVALIPHTSVCAQSPKETALARSLFEEGVQAADAQRWADAAERFGSAYGLKPTPGIAFNWACALIELGRLVEAGELLRSLVRDAAADPVLRADSEAKLAAVAPRIAALVIHVQGASDDVEVRVDGSPLLRAAWGVGSPTDPGAHTVSLLRGDAVLASEQVELADAERRELVLVAPDPPPPPVHVAGSTTARVAEAEKKSPTDAGKPLYKSWVLWTAVGAALVAGAVTTGLLVSRGDDGAARPVTGNVEPGVIHW